MWVIIRFIPFFNFLCISALVGRFPVLIHTGLLFAHLAPQVCAVDRLVRVLFGAEGWHAWPSGANAGPPLTE